jgi:DEAD/DEAH box helicase domain-containing protein
MVTKSPIGHFLDSFFASERLRSQVVFKKKLPATEAIWAEPREPWPDSIRAVLESAGIKKLYRHQATAIDFIRNRQHVIVATPTASGKTLVYDLPVLEHFLESIKGFGPGSTANP